MKITDPDVIKSGEKDLIDSVRDDLDLDAVKEVLKKRMAASALSASGGEIIVHDNQIAFRMDFNIELSGSLMFDREGNYIPGSDEIDDTGMEQPAEDTVSDDLDDDIDIGQSLEELGPDSQTPETGEAGQTDEEEPEDEEDLDINLPDYSLDDTEESDGDTIEADPEDPDDAAEDLPEDPGSLDDLLDPDEDETLDDIDPDELLDIEEESADDNSAGDGDDNLDQASLEALNSLDQEIEDIGSIDDLDIESGELDPDQNLDVETNEELQSPDDESDDDMNDILKDSRDFWENKKDDE